MPNGVTVLVSVVTAVNSITGKKGHESYEESTCYTLEAVPW